MARLDHLQPSYSLTRSYRFSKWQLGLLYLVGLGLAVLFGFIAVATNAYQVHIEYTTDINGTVAARRWFQQAPFSWVGSTQTTCQDSLLDVGGVYITKNRGFRYTVDRIYSDNASVDASHPSSTLAYHDQTLQDCDVSQIGIDLTRVANTRLPENWWAWSGTVAYATTTCHISTADGTHNVDLKVVLPQVRNNHDILATYLTQNGTEQQAKWYGVQILADWYNQISRAMSYAAPDSLNDSYSNGQLFLYRNSSVSDFHDFNFFTVNYGQPSELGGANYVHPPGSMSDWYHGTSNSSLVVGTLPNISSTVNAFGKSFYSLLLSDFGIVGSNNALATPSGVLWLQNLTDPWALNASQTCTEASACAAGQINQHTSDAANLGNISSTQLVSEYICSVPEQRSSFTIFFTVVLAELVYLRGCWALFNLIATWRLKKVNSQANRCESCVLELGERARPAFSTKNLGVEIDAYSMSSDVANQPLMRRQ